MEAQVSQLTVVDSWGRQVDSADFKKADQPKTGDRFGIWSGPDALAFAKMPGGAVMQFDLNRLTLEDFRVMRDHYQINSSLTLLTFMLHQIDWEIECEDQKIADFIDENLRAVWTRLIRALSQAFWAGYSPTVIEYENNVQNRKIEINKFKDLVPEDCRVNWKKTKGYAPPNTIPPNIYLYDGIKQRGITTPIATENTLWYPLLMENGDYYGKKLLRAAFPAWFFSMLIHLFSNRYFERFGEPLPIGRADFEAQVTINGENVSGRDAMAQMLQQIRNRAVAVLPSDRDPETKEFDFDIEYLESQMRGADFERYLSRLDEEMSLALFTPILLFRTGQSGSYNLGVTHHQTYLSSLNAIAGDMKEYIDRFVVERLKAINFSPNAPRAQWVPRKMGRDNVETLRAITQGLLAKDKIKFDYDELGQALGMSVSEVKEVKQDIDPLTGQPVGAAPVPPDPNPDRPADTRRQQPGRDPKLRQ